MAFDDSFREREILDADETYRVCGIRKRSEIYDLAGFGEPMLEWSQRVQELGITVVPRQVYLATIYEQHPHRVAWVYRAETWPDEIEEFHHVACDCLAGVADPSGGFDTVGECPVVLAVLERRAQRVGEVLLTPAILEFYGKKTGVVEPKPWSVITIKSLVNFIMNYEKAHPEGWVGNALSGTHHLSLLATMLQIRPYPDPEASEKLSMQEILEEMQNDGSLVIDEDGETVSLPEAA